MKIHKFEVYVLDFEDFGPDEYKTMIENIDDYIKNIDEKTSFENLELNELLKLLNELAPENCNFKSKNLYELVIINNLLSAIENKINSNYLYESSQKDIVRLVFPEKYSLSDIKSLIDSNLPNIFLFSSILLSLSKNKSFKISCR